MLVTPKTLADVQGAVRVNGKISPDGKSVEANAITLLSALPNEKPGRRHRAIVGTVASTTPALTVTTADGMVVVITSNRTRVESVADGSASDITPGVHVDARVSGPDTALVASEVRVSPERPRGGGKKARK